MVAELAALIVGIFSVVGSLITAYFSYIIYKYNRLSKEWFAVTIAFILLVFVRVIDFADEIGMFPNLNPVVLKLWNGSLLITISVLFVLGFWNMKKNFETFEVVEKKTEEKIKKFRSK